MRLFVLFVAVSFAVDVQAGRGRRSRCADGNCGMPQFQQFQPPQFVPAPPPIVVQPAPVPAQAPEVKTETKVKEKRNKTVIKTKTTTAAFDCVNRHRAMRGLPPFVFDEGLTRAAEKCAKIKAQHCLSGHLNGPMSDFACLEPGVQCDATGADGSKIGANDPGWYTCCATDNYRFAGAGMEIGADGCKYFSLFVRR